MKYISLFLIAILTLFFTQNTKAQSFKIEKDQFLLNGKPFRILSGSMHYSRIPRAYWLDRMEKARAMGLNTICTYVFWDLQEPEPGKFDFRGRNDIAEYIKTAQKAGLYVILRPGPYVCSEWDFGGLPAWLLRDADMRIRCGNKKYMQAVKDYINRLGKELKDLQITKGGPIIMVQVENEYASYGNDHHYMEELEKLFREAGFNVPFFTSDGGYQYTLGSAGLKDALPVVNFGSNAKSNFNDLEKFRSNIPEMSGEYWVGWFTHWGDKEWGRSNRQKQKEEIKWMLETGKSINFYMFHGGTNFGFSAGANYDRKYYPDITSYDYDAPLDEAGNPTKKYYELRNLIKEYLPGDTNLPEVPASIKRIDIPKIELTESADLSGALPEPKLSSQIHSMEYYGQNSGFILYRTKLTGPKSGKLILHNVHDYAQVYLDGKLIGTVDRMKKENSVELPSVKDSRPVLDILVEALGRVNFGPELLDRKGITDFAELGGVTLMNWKVYNLPMINSYLNDLKFEKFGDTSVPQFYRGYFNLNVTGDTFLDMKDWDNGFVAVNGHNLGRYWSKGPQYDLYLPGAWLKKGKNEITVFDMSGNGKQFIEANGIRKDN